MGARAEDSRARAAAVGGARRGRAYGGDAWRRGRRHSRLSRAFRLESIRQNPGRGGDRRRVHPHAARRSRARGRCRGAVRRVSRALARRRSRPRAGPRCPAGVARNPQAPGDVGNDRWRAHRGSARRCAGDRKRRPRVSGRDPLSRPRSDPADRSASYRCRAARTRCRDRITARVPTGRGRDPPGRTPARR